MGPLQLNFTYWQPSVAGVTPPPGDVYVAEDGTSPYVTESGADTYVPES